MITTTTGIHFTTAHVFLLINYFHSTLGCTNILVTPGASEDGSSMIAYNADSARLMGQLYHYPPTLNGLLVDHAVATATKQEFHNNNNNNSDFGVKFGVNGPLVAETERQLLRGANFDDEGSSSLSSSSSSASPVMRQVYSWDSGTHLGEIPEAPFTYNVVGNTNEHGLSIGETTFGGIEILASRKQIGAKLDYGSLIWITLQRTKTAREAIHTMVDLMDTFGYASKGESFSIADGQEVWIMEVIGRGENKRGAVWVALRIPDGMISAHANQARIRTFPRNDPENCMYADDVVDLARDLGLYDGNDEEFSFSDVYDPITFHGARMADGRVWSIFCQALNDNDKFRTQYTDYVLGQNYTNRMPLWVEPAEKLSLQNVMALMRDHYENTVLDSRSNVGAMDAHVPYRNHPLKWEYQDRTYFNERTVAIQQTGWNFVAQQRGWMPSELSSILWFAVDDSGTTPRYPVYGSSRAVSNAYHGKGPQDGIPNPILKFDLTKSFWIQNMVSNFAYANWRVVAPVLVEKIVQVEADFIEEVNLMDVQALDLYNQKGPAAAIAAVTDYSVNAGDMLHQEWTKFYGELFSRFRDGIDAQEDMSDLRCNCAVKPVGLTSSWHERIVMETGSFYLIPSSVEVGALKNLEQKELKPIEKLQLDSFQ